MFEGSVGISKAGNEGAEERSTGDVRLDFGERGRDSGAAEWK